MDSDTGNNVQQRVLELRSYICYTVRVPRVLEWLSGFISAEDDLNIKAVHSRAPEKASFLLIDKLLKCTQPGKWKAFTEALEHADYPYVASLLKTSGKDQEHFHHQRKILQIFAPYLELQLEPCDIISQMGASGLINAEDIEEVMACQKNQGSFSATLLLLDRMQRRQEPSKWYTDFLKILYQKGYKDIVKEMEPAFTLDCEVLKVPDIQITDNSDSALEEHDCIMEKKIECKVMCLKSEISLVLNIKKLASALCQILGIEKVCHLMYTSSTSQTESILNMIKEISMLNSKTKWRQFINCLKDSDYTHLADILSRSWTGMMQCKERELIRLFVPTLGHQLDPAQLMPGLEQANVINHHDREEVLSTLRQSGSVAASVVLLDCMQCGASPDVWFKAFITELVNCRREDLAETIDPDFHKIDNGHLEGTVDESTAYGTDCLLAKLDETHSHIYMLEKEAMNELALLQKHFEDMKSQLKKKIENKTYMLMKSLQDVDENLRAIRCNEAFFGQSEDDSDRLILEEKLEELMSISYILRPMETFVALKELGVLQHPRHSLQRQNSFDRTENAPCSYNKKKHKVFALREKKKSSGSSSSSQSSGYLLVEKYSSVSSTGSSCDTDVKVNKQNANLAKTESSHSIPVSATKRFKQSVFHAVSEHEEQKLCSDEKTSSYISFSSVSDLPFSLLSLGYANMSLTTTKEGLRVQPETILDGTAPLQISADMSQNSKSTTKIDCMSDLQSSSTSTMCKSYTVTSTGNSNSESSELNLAQLTTEFPLREEQVYKPTISHSSSDISDLLPPPQSMTAEVTTAETDEGVILNDKIKLINYSIRPEYDTSELEITSLMNDDTSESNETHTVSSTVSRKSDTGDDFFNEFDSSSLKNIRITPKKKPLVDRLLCHVCTCISGKKK